MQLFPRFFFAVLLVCAVSFAASAQDDSTNRQPDTTSLQPDTTRPTSVDPDLLSIQEQRLPKEYTIDSIAITGLNFLDKDIVASISGLQKGDKVVTIAGIHGTVNKINEDGTFMLEVNPGSYIKMEKSAVSMEMTANLNKTAAPIK